MAATVGDGKRVLSTYVFNQSVHFFITGLTFPILVLLIMDKGLGIAQAGVALAAYSAATILMELPSGSLADTIGRRNIYLLSLGVQAAGGLALLLSFDLITVMAATATMGAARALSSGSIDAWFIDEYRAAEPNGNIQHALARAGTFIPLGLGAGSLMGGAIPSLSAAWSSVIPLGTYSMNIVVLEIMVAVQFILTVVMVRENVTNRVDGLGSGTARLKSVVFTSFHHGVRNRSVLLLLVAALLFGISLSSLELLWQPRVQSILGTSELSWVLGILAAGYFFSASAGSMLSTRVCDLFHDKYPLVVFAFRLLAGAFLLLLAFQDTLLGFALFYFLILLADGVADPPDATMYNAELPSPVRSTMLSFKSLVLQIGGLIGTLAIGFLAGAYSIGLAWTVAAVVLAASSVPYLLLALWSTITPESEEAIRTA